jgi:hypothetical protein
MNMDKKEWYKGKCKEEMLPSHYAGMDGMDGMGLKNWC